MDSDGDGINDIIEGTANGGAWATIDTDADGEANGVTADFGTNGYHDDFENPDDQISSGTSYATAVANGWFEPLITYQGLY